MGDLVAEIIMNKHKGGTAEAVSQENGRDKRAGHVFLAGVQRKGELKAAEEYLIYLAETRSASPATRGGLRRWWI